jgi:hypothetical protein
MAIVELHPDAQKRAYLRGGQYGPGMNFNADCEVTDYQFPADETPGWDTENKEDPNDWAFIRIRVNSDDFGSCTIFHHEPIAAMTGSKLGQWLAALGVPVEGETFRHDTDQVVGRKCAVEMGDPREDKHEAGKFYTGRLLQVYGV